MARHSLALRCVDGDGLGVDKAFQIEAQSHHEQTYDLEEGRSLTAPIVFHRDGLKSLCLCSSVACEVKLGEVAIELEAQRPLLWYQGCGIPAAAIFPKSADVLEVTALAAGKLDLRVLQDLT